MKITVVLPEYMNKQKGKRDYFVRNANFAVKCAFLKEIKLALHFGHLG